MTTGIQQRSSFTLSPHPMRQQTMDDNLILSHPVVHSHYGAIGTNPRARASLPALRVSLLPRIKQRLSSPTYPPAPSKPWTREDFPPSPMLRKKNEGDVTGPPTLTLIMPKSMMEREGQAVKPLGVYGRGGAGKKKIIQKNDGDDASVGSRTPTSTRTRRSTSTQSTVTPTKSDGWPMTPERERTGVTTVVQKPVKMQGGYGRGGAGRGAAIRTGSVRAKKGKGKDKAKKSEGGKMRWFAKRKAEAKPPSTRNVPAHLDAPAPELDAKAIHRPTPDVGGYRTDDRRPLSTSFANGATRPQAGPSSMAAVDTHASRPPMPIRASPALSPKDGDLQRAVRPPLRRSTSVNDVLPPRSLSFGVDSWALNHPRPKQQLPPLPVPPPGFIKGQHLHSPRSPHRCRRSQLPAPGPPPPGPLPPIPTLATALVRHPEARLVYV